MVRRVRFSDEAIRCVILIVVEGIVAAHQVFGTRRGRIATVLDDYRAWWPYDLVGADDEDAD
jgi:hypothetical protein